MDLHYLKIFNTVAEQQSFTKASHILHVSQPALSIQIKKLEDQINLKLFDKIGNKIHLNENGIMLYEYTQKIFLIIAELENNITDKKEFIGGTLNIGGSNTPGTYILPSIIGEFKKLYPQVNINLNIANTSEISHLISNGTLDIAINGGNGTYNNNIYVEKLMDDELIIVSSLNSPYSKKDYITKKDISQMSFIVHKTDSQLYSYYEKFAEEINVSENISMYLGNIDAIKRAVYANLGVSIMPYAAVQLDLEKEMLKKLNFKQKKFTYPYSLIYNKNKHLSITAIKFIEVLKLNIQNYYELINNNLSE